MLLRVSQIKRWIYLASKQLKIPVVLLCSEWNSPLFADNACWVKDHELVEQHPRFCLVFASFWPCFTHFPFSATIVSFQPCFPPFPFSTRELCSAIVLSSRQFSAKSHLKQFCATCNTCNYFVLNVTLNNCDAQCQLVIFPFFKPRWANCEMSLSVPQNCKTQNCKM